MAVKGFSTPIPPNVKRRISIDFGFDRTGRFVITGKLKSTSMSRDEAMEFARNCGANAQTTGTVGATKGRSILVVGQDTTSISKLRMAIANGWEIWTEGDFLKLMYMHQLHSEGFPAPAVDVLAKIWKEYDEAAFRHTLPGNHTVNGDTTRLVLQNRIDLLSARTATLRDPTGTLTSIMQRANFYVPGYQMDTLKTANHHAALAPTIGAFMHGTTEFEDEDDLSALFEKIPKPKSKKELLKEAFSSNENYGLF